MYLETFPGVEVTVTVNGIDLKEYIGQESQDKETYIVAASGVTFCIKCTIHPHVVFYGDALTVMPRIDGAAMSGLMVSRASIPLAGSRDIFLDGHLSEVGSQSWAFSTLKTVEGPAQIKDREAVSKLGNIKVNISHRFRMGAVTPVGGQLGENVGSVPEKALKGKALSHAVSFGTLRAHRTREQFVTTRPVPGHEAPAAVYSFNYRSEADLKAMMILPRSPTPVALEDRDPETLSAEDTRAHQEAEGATGKFCQSQTGERRRKRE